MTGFSDQNILTNEEETNEDLVDDSDEDQKDLSAWELEEDLEE